MAGEPLFTFQEAVAWMERQKNTQRRALRCATCNCTLYEHRDHAHKPYPTCPFGDCNKFEEATG